MTDAIHPPRSIQWIVVHTCGAYQKKRVVHQSFEVVRDYHVRPKTAGGKGWFDIGYHVYIERDGQVRRGRADHVPGAHVEHFNAHTLGVACSGHGDYEPFNAAQLGSLVEQCVAWCRKYDLDAEHVIGHDETDEHGGPPVWKSCPGRLVDMHFIRAIVARDLRGSVGDGMPEA